MNLQRSALVIVALFVVVISTMVFQNCGSAFSVGGSSNGSSSVPVSVKMAAPGTPYSLVSGFPALDYSVKRGSLRSDITQCLQGYDACIFWRSPFATSWMRNSPLAEAPVGDALSDADLQSNQLFGVSLASYVTTGQLKNAHFDVYYTDEGGLPQRLTLPANKWQKSFSEGHSPSTPVGQRFAIEQIQTFFYLNVFRDLMVSDAGGFYASNGTIAVDTVSVSAGNNVTFDPVANTIYAGIRFGQSGRYYTLSQSAELVIREAARANLYAASKSLATAKPAAVYAIPCNSAKPYFVTDGNNLVTREGEVLNRLRQVCGHSNVVNLTIYNYCATDAGCWKAIELGQADFFAYVTFASLPTIGETAFSTVDVRYWKKRSNVTRASVSSSFGVSFYDDFAQRSVNYAGQVNGMAELFSEMLFDIYSDAGVDKPVFLKTVSKFLSQISTATTFMDAKQALLSIDQTDFSARNGYRIRSYFEQRGYN